MSSFFPTRRSFTLSMLAGSTLTGGLALSQGARAAAATSPDTPENRALLQRVEAYLNALRSVKADFVEVYCNETSRGTAWIQRPGRMRLDYKPPNALLVTSNHGILLLEDRATRQRWNVPMSSTYLGLLLPDEIRLSGGEITVSRVVQEAQQVHITLHRTSSSPDEGSMTLTLDTEPLALRQWVVTDKEHCPQQVSLFNLESGVQIDPHLFDVADPNTLENHPSGG